MPFWSIQVVDAATGAVVRRTRVTCGQMAEARTYADALVGTGKGWAGGDLLRVRSGAQQAQRRDGQPW